MKSKVLLIQVTDEVEHGGKQTERGPSKSRQVAYLHGGSAYPDKWIMRFDHTMRPIEPGFYLLGGGSYGVGQWGPEIRNPDLVPVAEAASQLAEFMASAKSGAKAAA